MSLELPQGGRAGDLDEIDRELELVRDGRSRRQRTSSEVRIVQLLARPQIRGLAAPENLDLLARQGRVLVSIIHHTIFFTLERLRNIANDTAAPADGPKKSCSGSLFDRWGCDTNSVRNSHYLSPMKARVSALIFASAISEASEMTQTNGNQKTHGATDPSAAFVEFEVSVMPPTTNRLNYNVPGKGRTRTVKYRQWRDLIGWELKLQKVRPIVGRVTIFVSLPDHIPNSPDLDNTAKALIDVLVSHRIVASDDKTCLRGLSLRWDSSVSCIHVRIEQCPPPTEKFAQGNKSPSVPWGLL